MFRIVFVVAALWAASARAQALDQLLEQAAAASPELAQARAAVQADRARIPQSGALPDPSLSLGIQNDGFTSIEVGKMETSFLSVGVTQPLPWPGKRGLREEVASFDQKRSEARLARVALDLEGRVRRAYIGLELARGQLDLLSEQEKLWAQAEQTARARYEAGQAPQSDLLRAQLERSRLVQRRWALDAELATRTAELNRLRAHPLDEAIANVAPLGDPPPLRDPEQDALDRSPELQLAALSVEQAGKRVELRHKEKLPDFAISAAVMPRGSLPPMWSLGLSVGLPIFSGRKQGMAVEEGEHQRAGEAQGAEAVRQVVRLRARERVEVLSALTRVNQHYRAQILVLSEAAARSTLAQYEVGKTPFAAVLEALSGYVGDRSAYLSSLAEAQIVAVAQRVVSLDEVPSISGGPGAGAMPGTSSAAPAVAAAAAAGAAGGAEAGGQKSSGMGGM